MLLATFLAATKLKLLAQYFSLLKVPVYQFTASLNNTDKLICLKIFSNYSILLPPRIHLLFNIALFAGPLFQTTIPVWNTGYVCQAEECFTP